MPLYVADSWYDKAFGFQYRDDIEEDEAMLFANMPSGIGFHMNNVGMSIAIASLDADFNVLEIHVMEPQTGTYMTHEDSKHILESSEEFFKRHGIRPGKNVLELLDTMPIDNTYFESFSEEKEDYDPFVSLATDEDFWSLVDKDDGDDMEPWSWSEYE